MAITEDIEELIPEGLLLGLFTAFSTPLTREPDCPVANFVPRH